MSDRPTGLELLYTARDALLSELADALPENRRYVALMIANALAIAARDLEHGAGAAEAELRSLRRLFQDPEPVSSDEVAARLAAFNRRLCTEIRQGRFSGGANEVLLRDHLRRSVEARVAVSNPKALS